VIPALGFVLFVELVKEGVEDTARHAADYEQNSRITHVANPKTGKFEPVSWSDVEVGDLMLLRNGDAVPSDVVLINTAGDSGQCWVETMELDGETNLKPRWAVKGTVGATNENDDNHIGASLEVSVLKL